MKSDLKLYLTIGAVLIGVFFLSGFYFFVGAGQVGVTFNTMTGKTKSYNQGFYLKTPLIVNVIKFDVKTQRVDIIAESASKDLQEVKVDIALNYHLRYDKVDTLFVKVGKDYIEKVINPAVNESVKAAAAQFPIEGIIVQREQVKGIIEKSLTTRLSNYNIIVEAVNLINISFSEEFNKVVEAKQIEEQKIKTAEYMRQQAEKQKQTTILQAEAESQKQNLLRMTTSPGVISLKWIDKWDGKLPVYMLGEKNSALLQMPNAQ